MSEITSGDFSSEQRNSFPIGVETPIMFRDEMTEIDPDLDENTMEDEYADEPRLRDLPVTILNTPRLILLAFVRLYQMTFSRILPVNTCRFYPSCSHYGYQAVYKYGVLKGSLMASWRVLRCNPFSKGGYDPVP
jgi:putative membrane protein insertion efficiency factor